VNEPTVSKTWLKVPVVCGPPLSNDSAPVEVTVCWFEPVHVQITVSPAAIVVVPPPETASMYVSSATDTFREAALVFTTHQDPKPPRAAIAIAHASIFFIGMSSSDDGPVFRLFYEAR
jgi:hypothetical protein